MWSVANHTPFAAQGYFVRDQGGAEHWVIAVRASFAIRPDGLVGLAETQEPVLLAPRLRDSNGREMIAESDIVPFRPQPDIILAGIACAPGGHSVPTCDIGLKLGAMEKRAKVFGRRVLRRTGRRSLPVSG